MSNDTEKKADFIALKRSAVARMRSKLKNMSYLLKWKFSAGGSLNADNIESCKLSVLSFEYTNNFGVVYVVWFRVIQSASSEDHCQSNAQQTDVFSRGSSMMDAVYIDFE